MLGLAVVSPRRTVFAVPVREEVVELGLDTLLPHTVSTELRHSLSLTDPIC